MGSDFFYVPNIVHTTCPYILHFLPELVSFCLATVFLMPKKLGNTESVLIASCACEKGAFSSDVLQHIHLADGNVEAAVTRQGWICHCKGPLCWRAWQGWHAREPSVEQCLAMCIVITGLVAKFSVNSCTVLMAVLKSKVSEQTLHAVNVSFTNPFYMRSQEFIVSLIEVLAVISK